MSLKKAILFIVCITLAISGTAAGWLVFNYYLKQGRSLDPAYSIQAIVQRSYGKFHLPTAALIELLGLSIDDPVNIYKFNAREAENQLTQLGIFKSLSIDKAPPGILVVHYELREPIAYLDDNANTALDEELFAFPFHPYYTPKNLPVVRMNANANWNTKAATGDQAKKLLAILKMVNNTQLEKERVAWVDVSSLMNGHDPFNEIIIGLNEGNHQKWLRLKASDMEERLKQYKQLIPTITHWAESKNVKEIVVDLRMPNMMLLK